MKSRTLAARTALVSGLSAIALIACFASPASAVFDHKEDIPAFKVPACAQIQDLAVDEANEWIYVSCAPDAGLGVNGEESIKRFDLDGNPAPFSHSGPYLTGNTITGNPGSEDGTMKAFAPKLRIAIDNSPSPNQGYLFITSAPDINVYRPTGEYAFEVSQPVETTIPNRLTGLEVGPDGSIYVQSLYPGGRVSKYNPQLQEVKRLYKFGSEGGFSSDWIKVDSTGALWDMSESYDGPFGTPSVRKFEADQFTTELKPGFGKAVEPRFKALHSPYVIPNPLLAVGSSELAGIDIDVDTNELYVNRRNQIEVYSPGTAAESTYQTTPSFGTGLLTESLALAVTQDHYLYASSNDDEIVRFGPGQVLPDVHTLPADIEEVGHKGATLHGNVELDGANGGTAIKDCKLEYGTSMAYGSTKQCTPDAVGANFSSDTAVSASTGETLNSGVTYHYRFMAENSKGKNFGADKTFIPAYVLKVQTLGASNLTLDEAKTSASAKLNASFDPDGKATEYKFLYGVTNNYGLETPFESGGSASGVVEKGTVLTDLPVGKQFHFRVVTKNADGITLGADRTFSTASPPEITGVRATEVTETSAILNASVNPVGFATDYHFEYGITPDLRPVDAGQTRAIGAGSEPVAVAEDHRPPPGVTYHFRVVAGEPVGRERQRRHDLRLLAAGLPERPRPPADRPQLPARLPRLRARLAGRGRRRRCSAEAT